MSTSDYPRSSGQNLRPAPLSIAVSDLAPGATVAGGRLRLPLPTWRFPAIRWLTHEHFCRADQPSKKPNESSRHQQTEQTSEDKFADRHFHKILAEKTIAAHRPLWATARR